MSFQPQPQPQSQQVPNNQPEFTQENFIHLINQVNNLTSQVSLIGQGASSSVREPKVILPDRFDGDRRKTRGFINQLELLFRLNPSRFHSEQVKIGLFGTLVTGKALDWYNPYLEKPESYVEDLISWTTFKKKFLAAFGDIDRAKVAASKLRSLSQHNKSVSTYVSEFRSLAAEIDWNDVALLDCFHFGLSHEIKSMLLGYPASES